jgi:hypothetical protein
LVQNEVLKTHNLEQFDKKGKRVGLLTFSTTFVNSNPYNVSILEYLKKEGLKIKEKKIEEEEKKKEEAKAEQIPDFTPSPEN